MPIQEKFKTVGDSAPVGQSPMGSPSALATRPNVSTLVGTSVEVSRTPVMSPSSVDRKGTFQTIGDSAPVSQDPNKTVGNSAMLPTSDTAKMASGDVKKSNPNEVHK